MNKFMFLAVVLILFQLFTSCDNSLFEKEKNNHHFVTVKGGTFEMGSDIEEDLDFKAHTVTLSDYKIGKYEVSFEQFIKFLNVLECNDKGMCFDSTLNRYTYYSLILEYNSAGYHYNGSWIKTGAIAYDGDQFYFKGDTLSLNDQCPVLVSWYAAKAYCSWVGGRLPTEAEWEFAASGGTKSKGYMFSGSDKPDEVAWSYFNSNGRFHPVGQLKPNELGIYDMSGNGAEFCNDYFYWNYYNESPEFNPEGPSDGEERVYKGGSFGSNSSYIRPVWRGGVHPEAWNGFCSFRVAKDIE